MKKMIESELANLKPGDLLAKYTQREVYLDSEGIEHTVIVLTFLGWVTTSEGDSALFSGLGGRHVLYQKTKLLDATTYSPYEVVYPTWIGFKTRVL